MITEKITEVTNEFNKEPVRESFMIDDIISFAKDICPTSKVAKLEYHDGCKKEEFEECLERYKSEKDTIICVAAYASTKEFPSEKYYLGEKEDGKEPLPLDEVLDRDSKILKECGFVDINNFIQYETQVAFIYPNKLGKQIIETMNKRLSENK